MPTGAILTFLFAYLTVFALLLAPTLLVLVSRRPIGTWRLAWAIGTLLPTVVWYLRGSMGPNVFIALSSCWLVYRVFLFCSGQRPTSKARQVTSVAVTVGLVALLAAAIVQTVRVHRECLRTHTWLWPVDAVAVKWRSVRIPPAFGCFVDNQIVGSDSTVLQHEEVAAKQPVLIIAVLWPEMAPVDIAELGKLDTSPNFGRLEIEMNPERFEPSRAGITTRCRRFCKLR